MSATIDWKVFLLLSMIVPIGLFTGLKLTETSQLAMEITTLNPVSWQFTKTSGYTYIADEPNAIYADNTCQMNFSVAFGAYVPSDSGLALYRLPIGIFLVVTSLSRDFSVRSLLVNFGNDPQPSAILVDPTVWSFQNLSLVSYSSGEEASVQLAGNSSSVGVNCQVYAIWNLFVPNNVTNSREVTYEVTCFNGTAYERIIQPFDLTLLGS
jgi:hypothetical protein